MVSPSWLVFCAAMLPTLLHVSTQTFVFEHTETLLIIIIWSVFDNWHMSFSFQPDVAVFIPFTLLMTCDSFMLIIIRYLLFSCSASYYCWPWDWGSSSASLKIDLLIVKQVCSSSALDYAWSRNSASCSALCYSLITRSRVMWPCCCRIIDLLEKWAPKFSGFSLLSPRVEPPVLPR